jgi:hypothetical protein
MVPSACPSLADAWPPLAGFDPSSGNDTGGTISIAAPTATPTSLVASVPVSPAAGVSAADSPELCAPSLVAGELSFAAVGVSPSVT